MPNVCKQCGYVTRHRSNPHNNLYWGSVIQPAAEALGYDPQELHTSLKHALLSEVDPKTGLTKIGETKNMDSTQFSKFVQDTIRLLAEMGVVLVLPGDIIWET